MQRLMNNDENAIGEKLLIGLNKLSKAVKYGLKLNK